MLKVLTAALLGILATACSQTSMVGTTAAIGPLALDAQPTLMRVSGSAFAPPAFYPFCSAQPGLCASTGGGSKVELTDARLAELKGVNTGVNRRIREVNDIQSVGVEDRWGLPTNVGDCEDFAILKKKELMQQGWPASALLLTVVTVGGEGHVVLTARTDRGDFVLDNRTNSLRDWTRVPYRFFARQSQSAHGKWERIVAVDA